MNQSIAAIPTMFDGIEYRSRLEAKWGSFFRRIGWEFTYEPFDGHGYIPDFVIHGKSPFLVEVKPAVTEDQYREPIVKIQGGLKGVWDDDALIVGVNPFPRFDDRHEDYHVAGLLGEMTSGWCKYDGVCPEPPSCPEEVPGLYFQSAPWCACFSCGSITVVHDEMSYRHRPCDHYDGSWGDPVSKAVLERHWAEATNEVKWRGTPR